MRQALVWFVVNQVVSKLMSCVNMALRFSSFVKAEYGLRLASHIFVKDISPESLAARDGNIQEGDVVLKVRGERCCLWVIKGLVKWMVEENEWGSNWWDKQLRRKHFCRWKGEVWLLIIDLNQFAVVICVLLKASCRVRSQFISMPAHQREYLTFHYSFVPATQSLMGKNTPSL